MDLGDVLVTYYNFDQDFFVIRMLIMCSYYFNLLLLAPNTQVNRQEPKPKHLLYWDGARRTNRSEGQMKELEKEEEEKEEQDDGGQEVTCIIQVTKSDKSKYGDKN